MPNLLITATIAKEESDAIANKVAKRNDPMSAVRKNHSNDKSSLFSGGNHQEETEL